MNSESKVSGFLKMFFLEQNASEMLNAADGFMFFESNKSDFWASVSKNQQTVWFLFGVRTWGRSCSLLLLQRLLHCWRTACVSDYIRHTLIVAADVCSSHRGRWLASVIREEAPVSLQTSAKTWNIWSLKSQTDWNWVNLQSFYLIFDWQLMAGLLSSMSILNFSL